eukprot:GHVQ01027183.1.p1 GENE.GHVQ01027183.1~~GHVQ01027183.1.p1  ORF type:complete len:182 (+),score=2.31 GHVQ01027183.1:696-1241(+)
MLIRQFTTYKHRRLVIQQSLLQWIYDFVYMSATHTVHILLLQYLSHSRMQSFEYNPMKDRTAFQGVHAATILNSAHIQPLVKTLEQRCFSSRMSIDSPHSISTYTVDATFHANILHSTLYTMQKHTRTTMTGCSCDALHSSIRCMCRTMDNRDGIDYTAPICARSRYLRSLSSYNYTALHV